MVMNRWQILPLGLCLAVLAAFGGLRADHWTEGMRAERLEEAYMVALAADLRRDRDLLEEHYATLEEQLRHTEFLLQWLDQVSAASSATRMEALSVIAEPWSLSLHQQTWSDLEWTGRGALVGDPRLREDLAAYYRSGRRIDEVGRDDMADFNDFLDEQLDRGHWLHWMGEDVQGEYRIDFRTTLLELRDAGLAGPTRGAWRALGSRAAAVDRLLEMNADLLERFDATGAR